MLKRGSTQCPKCKADLHWEQLHGMRLVRQDKSPPHYSAMCPRCNHYYDVRK